MITCTYTIYTEHYSLTASVAWDCEFAAISHILHKRCKTTPKLLQNMNTKPHVLYWTVSFPMTLSDR